MANQHGDFIWYELITTDLGGARAFYEKVVGWTIEAQPSGPMDYRMINSPTGPVAGLCRRSAGRRHLHHEAPPTCWRS